MNAAVSIVPQVRQVLKRRLCENAGGHFFGEPFFLPGSNAQPAARIARRIRGKRTEMDDS